MGLPYQCKFKTKTKEGLHFVAQRSKLGNVSFFYWEPHVRTHDEYTIELQHGDVVKLKNWLERVINHVER